MALPEPRADPELPARLREIETDLDVMVEEFEPIVGKLLTIFGGDAPPAVSVGAEASGSLICRVSRDRTRTNAYNIRIPYGLPLRLAALFRLLLAYYGGELRVAFGNPATDRFSADLFWTPDAIAPIFDMEADLDVVRARLGACRFPREFAEDGFWSDLTELTHLAVRFMLFHEAAHILRGHFELMKAGGGDASPADAPSPAERARAMELDADAAAAELMIFAGDGILANAKAAGRDVNESLLDLRTGYAVTALIGLMDSNRKLFSHWTGERYAAPIVRHQMLAQSLGLAAARLRPGDRARDFAAQELEGWRRCVWAFTSASLELMQTPPPGRIYWPIGGFAYGAGASFGFFEAAQREEEALLSRFRAWRERALSEAGAVDGARPRH